MLKSQNGFSSHVVLPFLLIAVLVIIAGWRVWNYHNKPTIANTSTTSSNACSDTRIVITPNACPKSSSSSTESTSQATTYTAPNGAYSFMLPAGWQVVNQDSSGITITIKPIQPQKSNVPIQGTSSQLSTVPTCYITAQYWSGTYNPAYPTNGQGETETQYVSDILQTYKEARDFKNYTVTVVTKDNVQGVLAEGDYTQTPGGYATNSIHYDFVYPNSAVFDLHYDLSQGESPCPTIFSQIYSSLSLKQISS